jgi:hypothetical protein
MKKLFLSLVVFSILFFIGCQENTITDPLSTESPGMQGVTNGIAVKNDVPDVIRFENELSSPYPANTLIECFIVTGTVEVVHKVFPILDPTLASPQYRVTVKLSMDAEMNCTKGPDRTPWLIKGDTENTIYLTSGQVFTLTKYYKIQGRIDRMQLVVKYGVTLDGVSLIDMKLILASSRSTKINSNL